MEFEEKFPSLRYENKEVFHWGPQEEYIMTTKKNVKKACLDKQKVKEAIEKKVKEFEQLDFPGNELSIFVKELLKELGLDDNIGDLE